VRHRILTRTIRCWIGCARALRGEYDVERRLGAGGMGYVYLGRDPALDMPSRSGARRVATARAAERHLSEARTSHRSRTPRSVNDSPVLETERSCSSTS